MKHRLLSIFILVGLIAPLLAACSTAATTAQPAATPAGTTTSATATADPTLDDAYAAVLTFNNAAWQYDATNDVYWQIGVQYVSQPAATEYETLGIYVPGAYLRATPNGDGTYTATVSASGTVSGFTASTAPLVLPVNTPGYSAQAAPTAYSYDKISSYIKAGFIYIEAGMRGRDNGYDSGGKLTFSGGAPWGVTDLKAAVRYVRYNAAALPGDTGKVFIFGMSGGGAQTAIMGASGDSPLYTPYLESIGAAMYDSSGQPLSDAVLGAMAWCPITSLDYADEAYEWNMGQYVTTGTRATTTWTSALSQDLATAYADYINQLGLIDANGNALTLEQSTTGIYAAGSYYDYVLSTVQASLNNFLSDTTFPYAESSGGGMPGGGMPPIGGTPPTGAMPQGGTPPTGAMPAGPTGSSGTGTPVTYQTVQDYIDSLNKDGQWVMYDPNTNTATVTSLAAFVKLLKSPSKSVAAFDALDRSQAENNVFGNDESDSLHFDAALANLLVMDQEKYAKFSDWDATIMDAYATDLKATDALGTGMQARVDMYNPMYYLAKYYKGYQSASVASYWRIRTGIDQGDTANTVEINLALTLSSYSGVKNVDFATIWGQGHTEAERTGNSTDNFIAWVTEIAQK